MAEGSRVSPSQADVLRPAPLCPRLPPATLSCSLCLAHSRAELRRTRDLGIASGMGELLPRLARLGDLRGWKENWRGTLDRPGCQQSVIPRVEGCRPLSEHPRQLLGFGPVSGLVREGRRGFHFLLGPSKSPRRSPGFRGQVSPRQRPPLGLCSHSRQRRVTSSGLD